MDPNQTTIAAEALQLSREQTLPVWLTKDALNQVIRVMECKPATAAGLLRQAHFMQMATPPAQRKGLEACLCRVLSARFPLFTKDNAGRIRLL